MSVTDSPMIWALDISKSCTGIAIGRPGAVPRVVSIRAGEGADDQVAVSKLGRWLIDALKVDPPDHVFYEAPLNIIPGRWDAEDQRVKATGNPRTTIALAKMVGVVEFICGMKSVALRTANVQTVRAKFLGHGRPEHPKQRAQAMCRALGWGDVNQDEADALAVWWYACMQTAPRAYHVITPMLQAKVATEVDSAMTAKLATRKPRVRA
jgi:hypothetical protein